ncbi:hypothetical protein OCAE111667_09930 [Occultella aeris]|uniref:Secreted protein n=1 Tax=Occultella aeris TaxID=2761496 RepID=A0A7M4DIF4_9MICO|nr:hypothetical protein [Occultella aeris]VZO36727.1 hypothetical protein HALOF300_01905 [Occultella aeris]
MKQRTRRTGIIAFAAAAMLAIGMGNPPSAQAASLWHCAPQSNMAAVCTTITSAPPGGVQVRDRLTNSIWVLYNGDSVQIRSWGWDPSARCGINNNYFWHIWWRTGSGNWHRAYIGDWYLSTGAPSYWKNFREPSGGKLQDTYIGSWSGTCDVIA